MKKHNAKVLFSGNTVDQGEWLKYRKIGASAVHNLVEVDRYKKGLIDKPEYSSPWILYQELKGFYKPTFSDFMQDKLDFGHFAEDFIRGKFKEVAERQGMTGIGEVTAGNEVLGSTKYEFMTCTPDGWVETVDGFIPLECKTGDSFQWDKWSGDTVPDNYYSQCQWVLEITDKPYMFILGWINNRFTKVFTVERDKDFFMDNVLPLAEDFWKNFNQNIEPELVGNKIEAEALGIIYEIPKKEVEKIADTELDPEAVRLLSKSLAEIKELEKEIKKPAESIKIKIKKEMLEKGLKVMAVGNMIAKLDSRGYLKIA